MGKKIGEFFNAIICNLSRRFFDPESVSSHP